MKKYWCEDKHIPIGALIMRWGEDWGSIIMSPNASSTGLKISGGHLVKYEELPNYIWRFPHEPYMEWKQCTVESLNKYKLYEE